MLFSANDSGFNFDTFWPIFEVLALFALGILFWFDYLPSVYLELLLGPYYISRHLKLENQFSKKKLKNLP